MATAWFTWTFGSSNDGTAGWTQLTPYGIFGTGLFTHRGTAWVSVEGSGTRAVQYYSGTQLTPTGSQMLVVGHTTNSASLTTIAFSYVGQNAGGTRLYAAHGYRYYSGTGTSYLGFYTDYDGAIGTAAEATAAQHWNNFTSGYTTGTGSLVTAYDGAGTWTVTWTAPRGGSTGSHTCAFGGGTGWAPTATSFPPTIAYHSSNNNNRVVFHSYRAEGSADEPQSILYFAGTWAGGTTGTRQWGRDVLGAPSAVCDRAHYPGENRGWASTVSITLDDSLGQWGLFAGGTTGQIYEGTWTLQQWFAGLGTGGALGSWVRLFTGRLDADNVIYDYAERTVTITLESSMARAAETRAAFQGTDVSAPYFRVCHLAPLGTIAAVDADTGTVRIYSPVPWIGEDNCWLWPGLGTTGTNVRLGSSITPPLTAAGTGTIVIDGDIPSWVQVDGTVCITRPWPTYAEIQINRGNAAEYVKDLCLALNLAEGYPSGADWLVFAKQAALTPVNPGLRMFGGEKITDYLNYIMQAIGGFYSVDALGSFRARCILPSYNVAGTVDFNAAYDSEWVANYEPSIRGIEIDCSYNEKLGSYQQHVRAGGTDTAGKNPAYRMPWLGSGIEAESLAARTWRAAYTPRSALRLRYAGSAWPNVLPGAAYAVHNLPAHLGSVITGTNMICYARTYDYDADLVEVEMTAVPGGAWAYWDVDPADVWDGGGKVWY